MSNDLTNTNQNAKLALVKSKNLLDITNNILAKRTKQEIVENFENFRFSPSFGFSDDMSDSVTYISITPDGKYAAFVSCIYLYGFIILWELNSKRVVRILKNSGRYFELSPDGNYVVSANFTTLQLWDLNTGYMIREFIGHQDEIVSLAISSDSKYIVSVSYDRSMKLWELNSGKELKTFSTFGGKLFSIIIKISGQNIILISSRNDNYDYYFTDYQYWNLHTDTERRFTQQTVISDAVFTKDEKFIVAAQEKVINIQDLYSGEIIKSFKGHSEDVTFVAISTDEKFIVSASYDKSIKLWDFNSGKEVRTYEGYSNYISSLAIVPDTNNVIFSCGKSINVLNLISGEEKSIQIKLATITTFDKLEITSDGKYVVLINEDNRRVFDLISGAITKIDHQIESEIISYQQNFIYSVLENNIIKIFDAETGKELQTFQEDNDIDAIVITPDGNYIIVTFLNRIIKILDMKSCKEICILNGYEQKTNISIHTSSRYIVYLSDDTTIKLWDIHDNKLLATYAIFENNEWIAWTPNGDYNCSKGAEKYFCFVDDSKGMPEVVDISHPIYKQKKKDVLIDL